jgi:hypothetical protein
MLFFYFIIYIHKKNEVNIIIWKMINLENYDFSTIKYLSASFFATYCSGLVHPLDVIKTRLQSTFFSYTGHDGKSKA